MDRRKYLKTLAVTTLSAGVLAEACAPETKTESKPVTDTNPLAGPARTPEELAHFNKISATRFFTEPEMKTITVLTDIIIPKDNISGGAVEAGVPEFIEFVAKDMPKHQIPLKGGLRWIDLHSARRFGKAFADLNGAQQISIVDEIAFPEKAKPEVQAGVTFFNLMRDLTATGFFTSKIGIKDLGYAGNQPTQWDGVPQEVLDQYGLKYDERTLKESVKFDS